MRTLLRIYFRFEIKYLVKRNGIWTEIVKRLRGSPGGKFVFAPTLVAAVEA
jgi:hypothetical protein